jgi:hypothetical protein
MFGRQKDSKTDAKRELVRNAYRDLYDDDDLLPNERALNDLRMTSAMTQIKSIIDNSEASPAQKIIAISEVINA